MAHANETSSALSRILLAVLTLGLAACLRDAVPKTVSANTALPSLQVNGALLHVVERGPRDAPTVIVLHGGPGADHRYLDVVAPLAGEFHVIWYDQRGTGLSERGTDWDQHDPVATYLADLDALVERFGGGRRVHLLGHSWGAMLASAYAGQFPDKVAGLVLAEPGFLVPEEADAVRRMSPSFKGKMRVAGAWFSQFRVRGPDDEARRDWFVTQAMKHGMPDGYFCESGPAETLRALRSGADIYQATIGRSMADPAYRATLDFRAGAKRVAHKVLFLAGECDTVIGPAHQRKLARHFDHAKVEVVAEAGHFMFNDQPVRSLALVRAYLHTLDTSPHE